VRSRPQTLRCDLGLIERGLERVLAESRKTVGRAPTGSGKVGRCLIALTGRGANGARSRGKRCRARLYVGLAAGVERGR
jgi:hypothetical protein